MGLQRESVNKCSQHLLKSGYRIFIDQPPAPRAGGPPFERATSLRSLPLFLSPRHTSGARQSRCIADGSGSGGGPGGEAGGGSPTRRRGAAATPVTVTVGGETCA